MHNMSHIATSSYSWLEIILCSIFTAGTVFYFVRLISPKLVKKTLGYYDWENELWHGLCLLGMVVCFIPQAFPIPNSFWCYLFFLGGIWYLLRAYNWGLNLSHNKQWYDIAHSGMLFGMWWMFAQPSKNILLIALNAAFWLWSASYNLHLTYSNIRKNFKALIFGQDIAHALMALVMIGMTLAPNLFMPAHGHNASLNNIQDNLPAIENCIAVNEANFSQEVINANLPVVAIVYGGCEKCQIELQIMRSLAPAYKDRLKFVTINEDIAPRCKKDLGVTQCPTILIVENGKPISVIKDVTSNPQLQNSLDHYLSRSLHK
jgi:hypothetical protein